MPNPLRDKNEVRVYLYLHSAVGEHSPPAEPKSMILTLRKSSETTMFFGFTSPWTNDISCM